MRKTIFLLALLIPLTAWAQDIETPAPPSTLINECDEGWHFTADEMHWIYGDKEYEFKDMIVKILEEIDEENTPNIRYLRYCGDCNTTHAYDESCPR